MKTALNNYLETLRTGASTVDGRLAGRSAKQRRGKGGSLDATKCPELGQLLYDWFIDTLQIYSRVNAPLCLTQARVLKQRSLWIGYEPHLMPNLDGEAGKGWLRRWRDRFVKHLKVSRRKLKQRVGVYLKNVFALRFLWRKCFGDERELRWVSWDQRVAWFNNTALDATYTTRGYEPLVTEIGAHTLGSGLRSALVLTSRLLATRRCKSQ